MTPRFCKSHPSVVPAKAGTHNQWPVCDLDPRFCGGERIVAPPLVIPAKAGIHNHSLWNMGPRNGVPRRERRGVPLAGTTGEMRADEKKPQ
jgi:hypothetical protein